MPDPNATADLTLDELAEYWRAVATIRSNKSLAKDQRRQVLRFLELKFKNAWTASDLWLRESSR